MARKKYCLFGEITDFDYHGFWGDYCSPRSLREWLDSLHEGEEAEIEINSPGGYVVQGVEMANSIKNCKAKIVAHVTGLAASMASVVACSCDSIEMEEASFMMIHNPWGYAEGDADEMRKQAGVLDQMKSIIMSFYRGKFKKCTEDEISALMSEETWYTGNECLEHGLDCTVIASDVRAAASIVGKKFEKMPEGAAKFLTSKELTDEGKAEIEAARQAAKDASPAPSSTPSAQSDAAADWEARYKGASKKINELQAKVEDLQAKVESSAVETVDYGAVVKERDQLREEMVGLKAQLAGVTETAEKSVAALRQFEDQVKESGYENLAALIGVVSGLKADLEKSAKDLADNREQLEHMKKTRDLLTGGVLTASEGSSYADQMAAAKTPEERENLRNLKKAGKIK